MSYFDAEVGDQADIVLAITGFKQSLVPMQQRYCPSRPIQALCGLDGKFAEPRAAATLVQGFLYTKRNTGTSLSPIERVEKTIMTNIIQHKRYDKDEPKWSTYNERTA